MNEYMIVMLSYSFVCASSDQRNGSLRRRVPVLYLDEMDRNAAKVKKKRIKHALKFNGRSLEKRRWKDEEYGRQINAIGWFSSGHLFCHIFDFVESNRVLKRSWQIKQQYWLAFLWLQPSSPTFSDRYISPLLHSARLMYLFYLGHYFVV